MLSSPTYLAKTRQILKFLQNNKVYLSDELKSHLNFESSEFFLDHPESFDWDLIINELISLYIKKGDSISHDSEYSCLLQQEEFFLNQLAEEKVKLDLLQQKNIIFNLMEQITYKGTCLLECIWSDALTMKKRRTATNTNNIHEFLSFLKIFDN